MIFFLKLEFFEDTIAEEQYEAQKLDIMRDALRSKATYVNETKKIKQEEKELPIPLVSPEPSSPEVSSPEPRSSMSPEPSTNNGTVPINGDITSELPPPIENDVN